MQWDALAFLPHPTDITPPPRPFASVRFDPLAWTSGSDQRRISGCGIRWLLAGPDSLPLWLCRVCAFVLLRCFSCSHTVLPKEHSLFFFFFSHFPHVNAVFFFNSTCISLLIILVWLCMWRIIKNLENLEPQLGHWVQNQASAKAIPVLWPEPCRKWVSWTEEKP